MSGPKTKSLLVNSAAPMARSTGELATELNLRAKTEKLVFPGLSAFQSASVSSLFEESFARGARTTSMVASGPGKLLLELESRGGVQESSQTLGNPRVNAKRREQRLSAFAVYQCVGQFRGQNISSPSETLLEQTQDSRALKCEKPWKNGLFSFCPSIQPSGRPPCRPVDWSSVVNQQPVSFWHAQW